MEKSRNTKVKTSFQLFLKTRKIDFKCSTKEELTSQNRQNWNLVSNLNLNLKKKDKLLLLIY